VDVQSLYVFETVKHTLLELFCVRTRTERTCVTFTPAVYAVPLTWIKANPTGLAILPREGHSAAVMMQHEMWIFGGISYSHVPFNDVWVYDACTYSYTLHP